MSLSFIQQISNYTNVRFTQNNLKIKTQIRSLTRICKKDYFMLHLILFKSDYYMDVQNVRMMNPTSWSTIGDILSQCPIIVVVIKILQTKNKTYYIKSM